VFSLTDQQLSPSGGAGGQRSPAPFEAMGSSRFSIKVSRIQMLPDRNIRSGLTHDVHVSDVFSDF